MNSKPETRNSEFPVLIAGAGLTGLSCAYHLKRPFRLIEKEKTVGGTARSYGLNGFTFDHTGHLLHLRPGHDRRLILRLLRGNARRRRRNTWIFSHNVFTRYPFQANLYGLPAGVVHECLEGLEKAARRYGANAVSTNLNFRDWCLRTFGGGISRHFMLPYNRKLWSVPPEKMTADWCGPFVPRPRLEEVREGARRDSRRAYGYNIHFYYPARGGIQSLPDAFAAALPAVQKGAGLEKVFWREKMVLLSSGETVPYSRLVSTLPLPELLKRLSPFPRPLEKPAESLDWTSVLCLNLGVKRPSVSNKSWVYFPEKKFPFYRAGFASNFSPSVAPRGCSSLYIEVSYRPGSSLPSPAGRAALFRNIRRGLEACGILKGADTFPAVSFLPIPYAYVLYNARRAAALKSIFAWLEKEAHASSIGRYGGWKYSFMEEAVSDGRRMAEQLNGNG